MKTYGFFHLLLLLLVHNCRSSDDHIKQDVTNGAEFLCKELKMIQLDEEDQLSSNGNDAPSGEQVKEEKNCQGEVMNLSCGEDEIIKIVDANYGRRDKDTCSKSESPSFTSCVSKGSINAVKQICQNKNSCQIDANINVFGDPCPLVAKYLEVKYTCHKATSSVACEGEDLVLTCEQNKFLHIAEANVERSDSKCSGQFSLHLFQCPSKDALQKVQMRCQMQNTCTIKADLNEFGEPCPLVVRHLKVKYTCVQAVKETNIEISPGPPTIVSVTKAYVKITVDKSKIANSDLYNMQIRFANREEWFDVIKDGGFDFTKEISVDKLWHGREYELRIYLKKGAEKACIPYTRFKTLD